MIRGYRGVERRESKLKEAVALFGPIAVSIDASLDSFQHYKSGVYNDRACSSTTNHGALVVGYGRDCKEDYWIVKNR